MSKAGAQGEHVIIVGGISVNDPEDHDKWPLNFLAAGWIWAKRLKRNVRMIMFTPPYEARVAEQKKEHVKVIVPLEPRRTRKGPRKKDQQHFLKLMQQQAKALKFALVLIKTSAELTAALKRCTRVASIHYFGHSSRDYCYLDFSMNGSGLSGEQNWSAQDAIGVADTLFEPGATFSSYGCHQGEDDGLAYKLCAIWRIKTLGAIGKTHYGPIGRRKPSPFPTAPGYVAYVPAGDVGGVPQRQELKADELF
jgi:hypothetical protein